MTSKTAATRYARALFDVALKEHGNLQDIEQQLADFVALFRQHPTLEKVLLNPAVPVARKHAAVTELTSRLGVSPILSKLLLLIAERDRLVLLPDLLSEYREKLLDHQQVLRAEVTTTSALTSERAEAIEQRLAQVTGKRVMLAARVDPAIIGGIVARIGSTVYDGSLARQLEKMRSRLLEEA
jgi:F-type H+-transporting ATPase subunit delta